MGSQQFQVKRKYLHQHMKSHQMMKKSSIVPIQHLRLKLERKKFVRREKRRKVDLDAFAPSSLKTKLFSPDTTSSNNPTESFQIKVLNPSKERCDEVSREEQNLPLDISKKEVINDDVSKNMMDGNANEEASPNHEVDLNESSDGESALIMDLSDMDNEKQ